MLHKSSGIGLDIGSKKIKIARVRNKKDGLYVDDFGSIPTPAGLVEAGNIFDPERLGEEIGGMTKNMNIKGQAVVSAVSGQQVYTRNLVMPRMKLSELKEAVSFQAISFLPIPVEEAAMDIFPLRDFEDEEGKKTEIFFVAVRRQQVEALDEVCKIAGLKLVAVEVEPLAIYRVLGREDQSQVTAFLNIGASRSYFSVFKKNILVFYRSLAFGCSAFYQGMGLSCGDSPIDLDSIQVSQDSQYDYLVRDVIAEVARSVEYYNMQNQDEEDEPVEKIFLCGGGSRLKGLDTSLAVGIGRDVELANPLSKVILPVHVTAQQERDLKHDFLVALGLAARRINSKLTRLSL